MKCSFKAVVIFIYIGMVTLGISSCNSAKAPQVVLELVKIPLRFSRAKLPNGVLGQFAVKLIAGDVIHTPYGDIPVDVNEIFINLIKEQSIFREIDKDTPVLCLFDKKRNDVQCWKLKEYVKQISLSSLHPNSVELKVKNQKPLQIHLWIDTDNDIDISVETNRSIERS